MILNDKKKKSTYVDSSINDFLSHHASSWPFFELGFVRSLEQARVRQSASGTVRILRGHAAHNGQISIPPEVLLIWHAYKHIDTCIYVYIYMYIYIYDYMMMMMIMIMIMYIYLYDYDYNYEYNYDYDSVYIYI